MNTYSFALIQQTPQIHFQGTQAFCGLRASDVKPRLDKFLFEKLCTVTGFNPRDISRYKPPFASWLIGSKKDKAAFAYKFIANSAGWDVTPIPHKNRNFPMFFGNMGDDYQSNPKYLISAKEEVKCKVIALTTETISLSGNSISLKDFLKENVAEFFFTRNFGTRQTKGYGSYLVKEAKHDELVKGTLYFNIAREVNLFDAVELFYKTLRSGINLKGGNRSDVLYFKSLMFQYARSKNLKWDKKTIRQHFFGHRDDFKKIKERDDRNDKEGTLLWESSNPQEFNFRDWLGLSSLQQWGAYGASVSKVMKLSNQNIDRSPSPIIFKPVAENDGYRVYLILQVENEGIANATTIISSDKSVERYNKWPLKMYPNFNLSEYLKFAIGYFDADDNAGQFQHNENTEAMDKIATLKDIYDQLKSQLI